MNNYKAYIHSALLILISTLFSFCNFSKENSNNLPQENNNTIDKCDTLFGFAIYLLENCYNEADSVEIVGTELYLPARPLSFSKVDFSGEKPEKKRSLFSNKYHEKLDTSYLWTTKQLDTIFTRKDFENYGAKPSRIDEICYPNLNILDSDSLTNRIKNGQNGSQDFPAHYTFSKPTLSSDGNYLLIEVDRHCWGLCGSGTTYLFKKQKDKWELVWKNTRWVS
ncbi:hypothetical protein K6119_09865 [Paracrocinitomix mangrovi]|uniref:hypothetical protein n=1 Tax=Paracrocinitomix mangrovi TaxID=2862509 RepID=UPI001C8E9E38|nr:hypothetical protein [Paracrocinitomix mangrovi]UKN03796.1 hypothetical protein K6119_09865 [Paracrocinitomix mangrovi]